MSIYHPTERVAVEPEENSLHLKNLLGRAKDLLIDAGHRNPEADELLEPAKALLTDEDFWRHQMEGLAIFLDDQGMTFFRLPEDVPEMVAVSDAPVIKPLLSSVFPSVRFFVLALSQNELKLLHGSRDRAEEIDLARYDIPRSLEESLQYDDLDKPDLQHHPTTGPGRGPVGETKGSEGRTHGFHGHGESGEGQKTQVRGHLNNVSRVLDRMLGDQGVPLVLAAVDWIAAMYREVSSYDPILKDHVEGNPDSLSVDELHRKAVSLAELFRRGEIESWKEKFGAYESRGTGSTDLEDILLGAYEGRIARTFLARNAVIMGNYDPARQSMEIKDKGDPDNHDLLDLAAQQTLLTDGEALLLDEDDMPAAAPIAAMFRW